MPRGSTLRNPTWSVLVLAVYFAAAPAVLAAPRGRSSSSHKPVIAATRGRRVVTAPAAPALRSLTVLPAQISLRGPGSRQLLLVTGNYADGTMRDLSQRVKYAAVQPGIAAVSSQGLVTPTGDGVGIVKAFLGKIGVRVNVTVAGSHAPPRISFARDVVPILTRAGCNGLACHGSPVGRQGFKLSLFGADPAADIEAITHQERTVPEKGKRVDLTAPERSLVLLKPTMQVSHQGGLRFKIESQQYRTLLAWLKAAAPAYASEPDSPVAGLEVLPVDRVLHAPGEKQRLLVTARYADGTTEDVTSKSVFLTNDDAVAQVDDEGTLSAAGIGETTLTARYEGRVGTAGVEVPQRPGPKAGDYKSFRPASYIDALSLAKWKELGYVPSEPSADSEFLRRVRLDLTGTLPTPDEVRGFLADTSADKRAREIEALLATPEYVDWWSVFWGDNLRNNGRILQPKGAAAFHDWIRKSIADNKPYDQFVRELVTASGDTFTEGAANFYRVARTPPERAEQVAQLFLGVRLQCAQCHNHPFERWTRANYHEFAAFFARVQDKGKGANGTEVSVAPKGEYRSPETNQVVQPAVLGDSQPLFPEGKDRREVLADWLVGPENRLFARNLVNRLWGQMFGRGLVEPVDDVRVTNPPVNEALLDALAQDFVANKYDVKHVLRTIANSRTYQLSVRANSFNTRDRERFSRAYYRRLNAEALLDGICQATDQPEAYAGSPAGTRAIQLVDNRVNSYFLDIFGRPRREVVCTCEREETANMTQALDLINGPINRKISSDQGRVEKLIAAGKGDAEIVDELYLWALSRLPDSEEREAALKQVESATAGGTAGTPASASGRRQALEDVFWVLLNSREFLFNH